MGNVTERRERMETQARDAGFTVATYSPGDGVTRYRFGFPTESGSDYFALRRVFTALGLAEAEAFASGLQAVKAHADRLPWLR